MDYARIMSDHGSGTFASTARERECVCVRREPRNRETEVVTTAAIVRLSSSFESVEITRKVGEELRKEERENKRERKALFVFISLPSLLSLSLSLSLSLFFRLPNP